MSRMHAAVQIKQLKEAKEPGGGGFGFIRACDRAADVFFHFSQLSDVAPADLAPGDDVEFTVVREPLPDAPKAHCCTQVHSESHSCTLHSSLALVLGFLWLLMDACLTRATQSSEC